MVVTDGQRGRREDGLFFSYINWEKRTGRPNVRGIVGTVLRLERDARPLVK